jgi:hypothetical protein
MERQTLHEFEVYVTIKHDDSYMIEDSAYCDLGEYVAMLRKAGGIYDADHKGWVLYHRINYVQQVKP